jgi:hypothetical protein
MLANTLFVWNLMHAVGVNGHEDIVPMTNNVKTMTFFDKPLDTFEPCVVISERLKPDIQTISS